MNTKRSSLVDDTISDVFGEGKKKEGAKKRHRGDVVFPHESPKVKDAKDHFPINSVAQARNALARANQYDKSPEWYKGSLKQLVNAVVKAVGKKYPSIEISKKAKTPKPKQESTVEEALSIVNGLSKSN